MDIIAAIDAATGCQHCGGPLGASPSDHFCREACQTAWAAARVASPVATPAPDALDRGGVPEGFEIYVASALRQLIESHISEQMNEVVAAPWQPAEITFTALETDWDMIQRYYRNEPVELHEPAEPTDPRARALWLRQHRNTGPTRQRRTPRAINARRPR